MGRLLLAPMEGLVDDVLRDVLTRVGGYDLVLVGIGSDWGLQQRTFGMSQELFIRRCPASLLIVRGAATAPHSAAQSQPAVSPASA